MSNAIDHTPARILSATRDARDARDARHLADLADSARIARIARRTARESARANETANDLRAALLVIRNDPRLDPTDSYSARFDHARNLASDDRNDAARDRGSLAGR